MISGRGDSESLSPPPSALPPLPLSLCKQIDEIPEGRERKLSCHLYKHLRIYISLFNFEAWRTRHLFVFCSSGRSPLKTGRRLGGREAFPPDHTGPTRCGAGSPRPSGGPRSLEASAADHGAATWSRRGRNPRTARALTAASRPFRAPQAPPAPAPQPPQLSRELAGPPAACWPGRRAEGAGRREFARTGHRMAEGRWGRGPGEAAAPNVLAPPRPAGPAGCSPGRAAPRAVWNLPSESWTPESALRPLVINGPLKSGFLGSPTPAAQARGGDGLRSAGEARRASVARSAPQSAVCAARRGGRRPISAQKGLLLWKSFSVFPANINKVL